MIRIRGTVQYRDGREESYDAGPNELAEWELYALRHGYPLEQGKAPTAVQTLVMAHAALRVEQGFDTWRRDVSGLDVDVDGVPPTPPEASLEP